MSEMDTSELCPLQGEPIGKIYSTSESVQVGILLLLVGVGLLVDRIWLHEVFSWSLLGCVFGSSILAFPLCRLAGRSSRLGTTITVYRDGFESIQAGERRQTLFSDVARFRVQQTHHYGTINGPSHQKCVGKNSHYLGSRAKLVIETVNDPSPLELNVEYRRKWSNEATILRLAQGLAGAVLERLEDKLQLNGEVSITAEVFLTQVGLRIIDPQFRSERIVEFAEIGKWEQNGKDLIFFTSRTEAPFLRLPRDTPNLYPLMMYLESVRSVSSMDCPQAVTATG